MPVYTEVLEATKTSAHRAMKWTPAGRGRGELVVEDRRTSATYSVCEFAVGRGFTGRAVRMHKVGTAEVYCVRVGAGEHDHDCDCPGHCYGRGKACKHVVALRGLLANGWLDLPFDREDEPGANEDLGETADEVTTAVTPADSFTPTEMDMDTAEVIPMPGVSVVPNPELAALAGDRAAFDALTLRDAFAMAALCGIIGCHTGEVSMPDDDKAARWAYGFADAMLQRRTAS